MRIVIEAHELLPTSLQLESLSIETEGVSSIKGKLLFGVESNHRQDQARSTGGAQVLAREASLVWVIVGRRIEAVQFVGVYHGVRDIGRFKLVADLEGNRCLPDTARPQL